MIKKQETGSQTNEAPIVLTDKEKDLKKEHVTEYEHKEEYVEKEDSSLSIEENDFREYKDGTTCSICSDSPSSSENEFNADDEMSHDECIFTRTDTSIEESLVYQFVCSIGTKDDVQNKQECLMQSPTTVPSLKIYGKAPQEYIKSNILPAKILKMLEYIEKNRSSIGIFRKAGVGSKIQCLCDEIDTKDTVNYAKWDPDTVACCLKKMFREMPAPIIPRETYRHLKQLAESPEAERAKLIQTMFLVCLDTGSTLLLKRTAEMCVAITDACEKNLMTITNMAIVFAPNVIRDTQSKDPAVGFALIMLGKIFVETLIKQYADIFENTAGAT